MLVHAPPLALVRVPALQVGALVPGTALGPKRVWPQVLRFLLLGPLGALALLA